MLKANIETFLACDASYEEAGIVLYGAPFDSTTSYRPGTRFGSRAIRSESYGLESYSPYQDRDLTDYAVFDAGDQELCFGDASLALKDLRDDYLGAKLSHACVLRRCWEVLGDGRITQFGIRSGDREEWRWGKEHVTTHPFIVDMEVLQETLRKLEGKPVYFTLDLDVLDPSVFPGTGTPEPGGISFEELRRAVTQICSAARIVGCDVNELSPALDASGASTAVACKIVREMLLALLENPKIK